MKSKRIAILAALTVFLGSVAVGCGDSESSKRSKDSSSSDGSHLSNDKDNDVSDEVSDEGSDDDSDEDVDEDSDDAFDEITENSSISGDPRNILNGGYVSENDKYVFFTRSQRIYRYDKKSGDVSAMGNPYGSFNDVRFLNASDDGKLYFVMDNSDYSEKDENAVFVFDAETGKMDLFADLRDYLDKKENSDYKITSMMLADDALYLRVDYSDFISSLLRINVKNKTGNVFFSSYCEYAAPELYGFFAKDGKFYFASKKSDEDMLSVQSYDHDRNELKSYDLITEYGELNSKYKRSVSGYDGNYLYASYDVNFYNTVAGSRIVSFDYPDIHYYDTATGKAGIYDDVTDLLRSEYGGQLINSGKIFINGKYYLLHNDLGLIELDGDFKNSKVIYKQEYSETYSDSYDLYSFPYWGYGYANEHLWLIPQNEEFVTIVDPDSEKSELIDVSSAQTVYQPPEGELDPSEKCVGLLCITDRLGAKIYQNPSMYHGVLHIVKESEEVEILASVKSNYTEDDREGVKNPKFFYQIRRSNGEIGYVLPENIYFEKEPEKHIEWTEEMEDYDFGEGTEDKTEPPAEDDTSLKALTEKAAELYEHRGTEDSVYAIFDAGDQLLLVEMNQNYNLDCKYWLYDSSGEEISNGGGEPLHLHYIDGKYSLYRGFSAGVSSIYTAVYPNDAENYIHYYHEHDGVLDGYTELSDDEADAWIAASTSLEADDAVNYYHGGKCTRIPFDD